MYLQTTGVKKVINGREYLEARCICSKIKYYDKYNIMSQKSQSCGCNGLGDIPHKVKRTHALIKYRCHNIKSPDYPRRGGKGIYVADEWMGKDGVRKFWDHIGTPKNNSLSIDRIDGTKGYVPGNVRRATKLEQSKNTSTAFIYKGLGTHERSKIIGISQSAIRKRLKNGWTREMIINKGNINLPKRFGGKTIKELSKLYGIPEHTIRARIFRGMPREIAYSKPIDVERLPKSHTKRVFNQ